MRCTLSLTAVSGKPTRMVLGRPCAVSTSTSTGTGTLRGRTFVDANADGQFADGEAGLGQVSVKLTYANGLTRTATSDDAGAFSFDALAPGPYQVSVAVPMNYVATTDAAQDIEVVQDVDAEDVRFGLISTEAAGLTPDAIEHQAFDTVRQVADLVAGRIPPEAVNRAKATRLTRLGINDLT